MAPKGTMTVRVVSDTKPAEQGLSQFANKVQATGAKVEDAGRKMTVFASVPIAAAMGMATKAASDLEETLSKSNTVFGESAEQVEDWADTASESFGQSKREALGAASSFGNMFVQLGIGAGTAAKMSTEMTELASDFASFHNADITEVIEAQSAAFRGEYDSIQKFVPTINAAAVEQEALAQTGKKVTSELTAQEKALAVQTIMLQGAGDAMGDFDRTSDSAANQMRTTKAAMEDASAEIGTALLPLVADLAGGVADLAAGFADLPKPVQNAVLAVGAMLATAGPLMTIGGRIATVWGKAGPAFDAAAVGAYNAAGKMGTLAKAAGAVTAAFVAAQVLDDWQKTIQARAVPSVENLTASLLDLAETGDVTSELARVVGDDFEDLGKKMELAGNSKFSLFDSAGVKEVEEANAQIDALDKSLAALYQTNPAKAAELFDQIAGAAERQGSSVEQVKDRLNDYSAAITGAENANRAAPEAAEENAAATEELKDVTSEAADEQERLAEGIREVDEALKAHLSPLWATRDALEGHAEAQDELKQANAEYLWTTGEMNAAIKEHGRKSDEAAAAWERQKEAKLRVEEADRAVVESALAVSASTAELTAKMEAGDVKIAEAEAQLRAWVEQGLITEEQAYNTAQELRGIAAAADELDGRDVAIPVRLTGYDILIEQLREIDRLTGSALARTSAVRGEERGGAALTTGGDTFNIYNPAPQPAGESVSKVLRRRQYY